MPSNFNFNLTKYDLDKQLNPHSLKNETSLGWFYYSNSIYIFRSFIFIMPYPPLTPCFKRDGDHFIKLPRPYAKILGENKISASGVSPKWVKNKRRRKREREKAKKSVLTMASYALQTPLRVAHGRRLGQYLKLCMNWEKCESTAQTNDRREYCEICAKL